MTDRGRGRDRSGETGGRAALAPASALWATSIVLVAATLSIPVLVVFAHVFEPAGDVWTHLVDTVLRDYVRNSIVLMLGVAVGTGTMGVTSAWLVTMCEFPGRRVLEWALLLPLAMPAYIVAYTYTGMLDFAGPVQSLLRESFGWSRTDYWFPQVRSLGGAVAMLSLVLYPYVYLLSRTAFLEQSAYIVDASRTLGCGPWRSFARVSLPGARPAVIAGLSLALMETLADYGTVQYFGVTTFTTGIFRTWFGLGDSSAAAQLASVLLGFVLLLVVAERWSRRRARFHHVGSRSRPLPTYELRGARRWIAFAACLAPLLCGFVVPVAQLASWAWGSLRESLDPALATLAWNTVSLAAGTALLAAGLALLMAYGQRLNPVAPVRAAVRVASLGYAVPGTVIAVGVLLPFAWLDNSLDAWMRARFDLSTGLLLSGTVFALVFAYLVRFLAVALQSVEAGLGRIRPSMDDAARSLGCRRSALVRRVHLPMLRGSLLTAVLLVFVDVMKELPATLVLRPFNFNTLAVRTFELASDERLADAATPALAIVLAGLLPVMLLSASIGRTRLREHVEAPYALAAPASA